MKWGFKDLSNGNPNIPTYLWVFETRQKARDFKKTYLTLRYASKLSGLKKFTEEYLEDYSSIPGCIRPEYWKLRRELEVYQW